MDFTDIENTKDRVNYFYLINKIMKIFSLLHFEAINKIHRKLNGVKLFAIITAFTFTTSLLQVFDEC
jgi:hypothetical protein